MTSMYLKGICFNIEMTYICRCTSIDKVIA